MVLPSSAGASVAPRLLGQLGERSHYLHCSLRTDQTYVHWVRAFIRFSGMRHPKDMGAPEVRAFLSWLSAERQVSVSIHRQALSAVLFLYPHVFGQSLPWMAELERPQRKPRLPVVLTADEVRRVLALMDGTQAVLARLLYGTGLRITEALPSRVKDAQG
jgi:integrase